MQGGSIESTARNQVIQLYCRLCSATESRHDGDFDSAIARSVGLTISIDTMFVLYFMLIIKESYLLAFQRH